MRHLLALAPLALASGCQCNPDLERMIRQPSLRPYETSHAMPGWRMSMRSPPAGAVPRSRPLGPPELTRGTTGPQSDREPQFVDRIPVHVDRALLRNGRRRFDILCAACHGLRGDGRSQVAENMALRRPPSLVAPPVRDYPPGRIYRAIVDGYGLMPSYRDRLTVRQRWAVISYVKALALSQSIEIDRLPKKLREEARRWLK